MSSASESDPIKLFSNNQAALYRAVEESDQSSVQSQDATTSGEKQLLASPIMNAA